MNAKLRVLLVSPVGEHGGGEEVLLQLAKHLPAYDVEPALACLRPGPLVELARRQGITTYVFDRDYRFRQFVTVGYAIRWLSRLVRESKSDLLHSNHAAHLVTGPVRVLAKVPEVWHIHDYPYTRDFFNRMIERIPSSHVLYTTHKNESGYPQLHHLPHSVIHPLCIEPEQLRAHPSQPGIREQYHLPSGPLFLTVARLQQHKGHRYLIAAIPEVLQTCPDAVFAIVGKASGPEQEKYRQELEAQCVHLRVAERVRFPGYVSEGDLAVLYREATALVHPATSEGFGLTLLEAMALGTPVIAAAADGPQELITQDKTGLLVPTANSDALSHAIIRLLKTPALVETLRRESSHFADCCRVEDMAAQTAAIYRRLVH